MTLILFCVLAFVIVFAWNLAYRRVPWPVALLFLLLTIGYQAPTLFTSRVDLPGRLAYAAYPWRALGREAVKANTGIVFTQLAPWTKAARASIRSGSLPEWNRYSAGGTPLLANQQTALLHPFTLAGFLLSAGKAFTLSACLRLFTVLIFTFIFLRHWRLHTAAAIFGAVTYAFCTFHIVWLLFPLGLATMMFPLLLAGVNESMRRRDAIGALPLIAGTALTLLGGHPESAAWVMVTAGLYAIYCAKWKVLRIGAAFAAGIALTTVFWYPTWLLLPQTSRGQLIDALKKYPPQHHFSSEWLLPLVAPNVLGTAPSGTYQAPKPANPGVLDDYGEVASGYAGVVALGFAIAALRRVRARPRAFLIAALIVAVVTFLEPPLWRDVVRRTPLIGLTLLGRLRFVVAFAVAMLGACGVDDWLRRRASSRVVAMCLVAAAIICIAPYAPKFGASAAVALAATICAATAVRWRTAIASAVIVIGAFAELVHVTHGYNPLAKPQDVYPVTGAIHFLQTVGPSRFVPLGWSFLAETASWYGIEDLKTTDPISNGRYLHVLGALTSMRPGDYDQIVDKPGDSFLNFLGVAYIYVPPDRGEVFAGMKTMYAGPDGRVLLNPHAMPRYYAVNDVAVEPNLDSAIARLKPMYDWRHSAVIDAVPANLRSAFPGNQLGTANADVAIEKYGPRSTDLRVKSDGWALVVTSDTAWPGWKAKWNGRSLPITVVNGAFVAVFVPPGEGRLRLEYEAPGLRAGFAVSLLTALLIVVAALFAAKSRPVDAR